MADRTLHLIILAGGSGTRMAGDETPKQFRIIGGRMLLLHSVRELARAGGVKSLTITCPDDWRVRLTEALSAEDLPLPVKLAPAGDTRTASTLNALQVLAETIGPAARDLVAIHDAARPAAGCGLLEALADAAFSHGAAVPAVPVADTIIAVAADARVDYLQRDLLRAVQTPQVFHWEIIEPAHRWAAGENRAFTDDGSLCAARGVSPVIVPGEAGNRKITTAEDLQAYEDVCGGGST